MQGGIEKRMDDKDCGGVRYLLTVILMKKKGKG